MMRLQSDEELADRELDDATLADLEDAVPTRRGPGRPELSARRRKRWTESELLKGVTPEIVGGEIEGAAEAGTERGRRGGGFAPRRA
jgi:hypothetical protein